MSQLTTVGAARPYAAALHAPACPRSAVSAQPAAAVGERWLDSFLGFVRVDQTARPEPCHDFWQSGTGDREAALAATENTGEAEHSSLTYQAPCNHDRPERALLLLGSRPSRRIEWPWAPI